MGLDMYLSGNKYLWNRNRLEDGKPIKKLEVDLGYWRKHPNLHGFIVDTFADGVDECQKIDLNIEAIDRILLAINNKTLPHTEGFFFGKSELTDDQVKHDFSIFEKARQWLEDEDDEHVKTITYQASW